MKKMLILMLFLASVALAAGDDALVRKARAIHEKIVTVDTHNDTTMTLDNFDIGQRHEPGQRGSGKQDLPRMKEGGLDASFFAVFVGQGPLTIEGYQKAKETADHAFDNLEKIFLNYPDLAEKVVSPDDLPRIVKSGRRAIFIGMENGYPLGTDLTNLDGYWRRGVRYVTLCHSGDNQFCDTATDYQNKDDKGLSDLGKALVARMNQLGILVDVSHISERSFYDVLALSKVPVFASHASCRALCDTPRNLSDEMLRALKKHGGVVQVCLVSDFLKKFEPDPGREQAVGELRKKIADQYGRMSTITDPAVRDKVYAEFDELNKKYPRQQATVKDLVDHIDHVVKLIGIDYVGIGSDFDGGGGITGCDDVTEMPNITIELLRRGYGKKEIAKIWGGNFLRVFRKATAYAVKQTK